MNFEQTPKRETGENAPKAENQFIKEAERLNPELSKLEADLRKAVTARDVIKKQMQLGTFSGKLTALNEAEQQIEAITMTINSHPDFKKGGGFDKLQGKREETIARRKEGMN